MDTVVEKKTREQKPERRERKRGRRLFGEATDKLAVENKQDNFHYVWLNDVGATIRLAIDAGYEHVEKTDPELVASDDITGTSGGPDSRVCKVVNRHGTIAFLMRIPQEWWDEDEAERAEKRIDPRLKQIIDNTYASFEGEITYKNHDIKMRSTTKN